MPMSVNEYVIRPLLSNISVVGLFFIPMITMRLFAEEKRMGTIELLATSPIRDTEVIIGKWLSALILYGVLLLFSAVNFAFLFRYGNPDWKPLAIGYLGLLLQAGGLLAIGTFISTLTKNQIIAGAATFGVCLLLWVLEWVSGYETATWAKVLAYFSVITHYRFLFQRRSRHQGRGILCFYDFPRALSDISLHGVPPVEVVSEYRMDASKTNQVRRVCDGLHPRDFGRTGAGEFFRQSL